MSLLNMMPTMLKNSIIGILASAISIISTYCIRIVISSALGEEVYGINSIFISIVSAMLILEFGMCTAIVIILYKPIVDDDRELVKSILGYIKSFYKKLFFIIIVLGVLIDLFLEYFVNTDIDYFKVKTYFVLYIIGVGVKYRYSYKLCLLYADKKNGVVSIVTIITTIVFSLTQIAVIYCLKDYYSFLLLFVIQNLVQNAICNVYVNRHYKYIREGGEPLSEVYKQRVKKILQPMFIQRIADQIKDSSSVIVFGVTGASASVVGFFSNYIFIVHACQTLFNQVGASFTTSFGNYLIKNNRGDDAFDYYLISRFYMSWVATIFATLYGTRFYMFIFW